MKVDKNGYLDSDELSLTKIPTLKSEMVFLVTYEQEAGGDEKPARPPPQPEPETFFPNHHFYVLDKSVSSYTKQPDNVLGHLVVMVRAARDI